MTGRVYLVGAGCGGPELLTLRGAELLRSCDAVVYDSLIGQDILSLAPAGAERIYMGKRAGDWSASQEEICAALIDLARAGKRVVRLKGGDPFVFGRGGEEVLALREAGIDYEVVPGITSAIAVPVLAGIPVTQRGMSQGLHIITAHTAGTPDGLPDCFDRLARLPGTLVFLMGLGQLERIVRRLTGAGMPGETPAAAVSGGNAPFPAAVRGTLAELPEKVRAAKVQPPAVIVVGDTAAMDLSPSAGPLRGVRVGLTGTDLFRQKLRRELEAADAQVFDALPLRVRALPLSFRWDGLRTGAHWIVLTSANGVDLFFRALDRAELDLRALYRCRFAAIGPATAARLRDHGLRADLCPEEHTSRGLAQALLRAVEPGEDVLLFRSRQGSPVLPELLGERSPVEDIPLYESVPDLERARAARPWLEQAGYLTFASAGGVEQFIAVHGSIPEGAVPVCIGAVTARELEKVWPKPFLTARSISAEGIAEAILAHRQNN